VNNTDKIRELEQNLKTFVERVDNLLKDLRRHEDLSKESSNRLQELQGRFALIEHRGIEAEKKISESSARRWQVLTILITAILTFWLTQIVPRLIRSLEPQRPAATSRPDTPHSHGALGK